MNFLKKSFIAIFLLSQISALQAMNHEHQMIQVPTKEQIQQIHDKYYRCNVATAGAIGLIASYIGYRVYNPSGDYYPSGYPKDAERVAYVFCAAFPIIACCWIRTAYINSEYEGCAFEPLSQAVQAEDKRALRAIIRADSINMKSPKSGLTPLRMATLEEKKGIVNMLLKNNAHREDEAVFDSIKTGNAQILELLLRSGCRSNARQLSSPHGHIFALNFAVRLKRAECAKVLLKAGAHRNFTDANCDGSPGKNAYQYAQEHDMTHLIHNYDPNSN